MGAIEVIHLFFKVFLCFTDAVAKATLVASLETSISMGHREGMCMGDGQGGAKGLKVTFADAAAVHLGVLATQNALITCSVGRA